jgi:hypothetical protein
MSKKQNNATCAVCGNGYYLCIACNRNKTTWKPWMVIVDNENCYNVYDIVSKYIANDITKEEAKELLNQVDLSGLDGFRSLMKSKIKEILEIPAETSEVKEVIEEITVIEEIAVESNETVEISETSEVGEVVETIEHATTSKKKYSKKHN